MSSSLRQSAQNDELRLMDMLSHYLNETPCFIKEDMVAELLSCGIEQETAFSLLMASAMGLDIEASAADRTLYHAYFPQMIKRMRPGDYNADPYYASISLKQAGFGNCSLRHENYKPYEAFVRDDIFISADGRRIPQIGYFDSGFSYPAIFENDRLWMSLTPNEVNTMASPIAQASGRVLSFGLGLGYFAYMASLKKEVSSVTIVEKNPHIIELFQRCILPQFRQKDKISIVKDDAFEYARKNYAKENFDFAFTDLWHDVSDGLPMYLEMKRFEALAPNAVHTYWIEKTMLCYL